MAELSIAFFGDIVGTPGVRAFANAARILRDARRADVILVNAENARNGSGLSPELYKDIRRAGADGLTLGDHCYRDRKVCDLLEDAERPVARPANFSSLAVGKTRFRASPPEAAPGSPAPVTLLPGVHVVTVLGRLFMSVPANDPFEAVDREVRAIEEEDPEGVVVVEVHAEATSEKQAMAWHCVRRWPGRVLAVVGTHTHVQTADARILDGVVAAITDLGMCGGRRGVIGRKMEPVLEVMTRQIPLAYDVADEDAAATGVLIRIDVGERTPLGIEPLVFPVAAGGGGGRGSSGWLAE